MIEPMRLNKARQPQENYSRTTLYDTAPATASRDKLRGFYKQRNAFKSVVYAESRAELHAKLYALCVTENTDRAALSDYINDMPLDEIRDRIAELQAR